MRKLFVSLFLVLFASASPAQSAQPSTADAKVDALVHELMQQQQVPGLTLAIIERGRVVLSRGYGMADVENKVPATQDSEMRTASVAKPMTAVAAMKLVSEGKLDLDVPVQRYCPAFPQKTSPDGKPWTVTTRELLSHTAGLGWYADDAEQKNSRHYASIADSVRNFGSRSLLFEPGTSYRYSSYGFVVVGCAIEGASGMPYLSYLQQAVLRPAGMDSTVPDDPARLIAHRAHGYELSSDKTLENAPYFDPSDRLPAGGFLSTSVDLVRFASAVMGGKLVSADVLHQMWRPAGPSTQSTGGGLDAAYGLGWGIYKVSGRAVFGHNGGQVGTSTALRLMPDQETAVAIMVNREGVSLDQLAQQLVQLFAEQR